MPRVRLGVALLVPAPLSGEIDGLRRALGDGALARIPSHLTLVPPVNVRVDRLSEALAVLRAAAAATRPFTLTLGPPATFLPGSPTLHLSVADAAGALHSLRDRVFVDPLARPLTWPFVPHVTLCDDTTDERVNAGLAALADFRADMTVATVHLLREGAGRIWTPIADAPFARPAVIGRGGLPLELSVGDSLDPEATRLAEVDGTRSMVVTARAGGAVVGFAEGWCRDGRAHLSALVVAADHGHLDVDHHLLAAFRFEAAERGCDRLTTVPGIGGSSASG